MIYIENTTFRTEKSADYLGNAGYTPYLLQLDRGMTPTWAGYFGAIHALTWSLSALCVASLAPRWHSFVIFAGPATLALGLAIDIATPSKYLMVFPDFGRHALRNTVYV